MQQIKSGSLLIGNMRISLHPDIYTTGKNAIQENKQLFSSTAPFTATKLALMVPKGNLYVKALIGTTSDNVPALPVEAVIESEGKDYIFIQTDTSQNKYTFRMIPVIKGTEQEGYVAVTLMENVNMTNSKVVVKGAYALLSAMKNVGEE
ncbi:MAG: hypothetical protein M3Z92_03575 [Bacteroidota bacterium]|nr:hypothetical protein [Bacteroidota bacterium]